jgi:integrase
MTHIDRKFLAQSRNAFLSTTALTLQDIRDRVSLSPAGHRRRDQLSALDTLAKAHGIPLSSWQARPDVLRELFDHRTGPQLGLSERRYANVCSGVRAAVRKFGEPATHITKRIPIDKTWHALLDRVAINHHRTGLSRLASYCSAMGIAPEAVGQLTLLGLHEALVAEEMVKNPRKLLKSTITLWNSCGRQVAGWPSIVLASPFKDEPIIMPLEAFPESFRQDLAVWRGRLESPDPFDPTAPHRALRPSTIKSQTNLLRRSASILVRTDTLKTEQVTSLGVLIDVRMIKIVLRFQLDRHGGDTTAAIHHMAQTLKAVAVHYCRVSEEVRTELDSICKRLDPHTPQQMTARNRERLRQMDDPETVARLLDFPARERARGLTLVNRHRAAKCFERALAVALLIDCCPRIQNLRSINMETQLHRAGASWYLSIDGSLVKNGQALEFILPGATGVLLDEYVRDQRPHLPGNNGPYLFPGRDGGPRPHGTMRSDIKQALLKRAGIVMNPHLMRHVIAKIVIEHDPGMALAVSRHLGHKRIDTTMAHYLGTETRAVGRRIDSILRQALINPHLKGD